MAAPKGNRYACGNRGGGAPLGNKNSVRHGGYCRVTWDMLTDEEIALIEGMSTDTEDLLCQEISLLLIMERRVMTEIQRYSQLDDDLALCETIRREKKRTFDTEEERLEYELREREKVDSGDTLPGRPYTMDEEYEAAYSILIRLENHLTRIQRMMTRCIEALTRYRADTGDRNAVDILTAIENALEEGTELPKYSRPWNSAIRGRLKGSVKP